MCKSSKAWMPLVSMSITAVERKDLTGEDKALMSEVLYDLLTVIQEKRIGEEKKACIELLT